MATFIVYCQSAGLRVEPNNPSFGRFDLVARCVNSALWLDGGLRKNIISFYLAKSQSVLSFSDNIRQVSPDERSILMWIEKIFAGKRNPGITIQKTGFEDLLKKFEKEKIYLLNMKGKDLLSEKPRDSSVFILSDNLSLPGEISQFLESMKIKSLSIGPKSYLASHAISFVNISTDGFSGD